jgi:hypothetical protein
MTTATITYTDGRTLPCVKPRMSITATPSGAVAASGSDAAGYLAGYCEASPGCRSVWYRPRCEKRR